MALVTVPGREKEELLRGEERGMGSCKGGRELQVNPFTPDRCLERYRRIPFQKEGIYRVSCIVWHCEISHGNE